MTAPTQQPEFEDRLAAWAKQNEQAQAQIALVRGKGIGVDGYLVVIVDAGGKTLSITTEQKVSELHHENLGPAIMRAYKAACADAEKQVAAITAELYKDPEIRAVLQKINPSQKLPEQHTTAKRGPDPEDEEAWNDAKSWLEKA